MMPKTKTVAVVLASLMLAATACGGDDAGDGVGWIVGLLERLPDAENSGREIQLADLGAAAVAAGISVPAPGAPAEDIQRYLVGLPRDALVPEIMWRGGMEVDSLRTELGLDLAAVRGTATAGWPPELFVVLRGDFDAAVVDAAVRADPVWSDVLAVAEYDGVDYYTWGDDFEHDLSRTSAARPLGWGGRLALDDGCMYWVPWTAGLEALIDAGAGTVPTLADRPTLRRAAELLQQEQVYSALLTDQPLLPAGDAPGGRLAPYLALGLGGGGDADGIFWVVVAVHATESAAEESAAGFRSGLAADTVLSLGAPWSDMVTDSEVTTDGTAMIAVLRTDRPAGDWTRAYMTRDPLIAVGAG